MGEPPPLASPSPRRSFFARDSLFGARSKEKFKKNDRFLFGSWVAVDGSLEVAVGFFYLDVL